MSDRRIGALAVIALAVFANLLWPGPNGKPSVLGAKSTRCIAHGSRGGVPVPTGVRRVEAEPLTVTVKDGRFASALVPAVQITPGQPETITPVSVALGVGADARGSLVVDAVVSNATTCPVALLPATVSARRGMGPATTSSARFGGRDRLVVPSASEVRARVIIPVGADGIWQIGAVVAADVGARA